MSPNGIDWDEVRRLRDELAQPDPPSRAKALPLSLLDRTDADRKHRAAFVVAVNYLIQRGWSIRAIARHMGLKSHASLIEFMKGTRRIGDRWPWLLPSAGIRAYKREMELHAERVELDEEPPSGTGTDGY